MNETLERILHTKEVQDASGNALELHSHISRKRGDSIFSLIRGDSAILKTLEVGCAYGISSLFITEALRGREMASHTIIDYRQSSDWKNIGILNLRRCGIDYFQLVEEPSEFALPRLAEKEPGQYDFILIDGWHTFDHTLVDVFYANRLLRVGGYLAVDDCSWRGISKVIDYAANYPAYRIWLEVRESVGLRRAVEFFARLFPRKAALHLLPKGLFEALYRHGTMVILKKVAADERPWNWYKSF